MTFTKRMGWPTPWKKTARKPHLHQMSLAPKLLIRGIQDLGRLASAGLISDRGPGDLKNFT